MAEYHNQSKLRFWCQMVLPLVYDDSLSYMELLNKVVTYLNNCIQDVGNCETNIESLLEAFVNLQDYVNEIVEDMSPEIEAKIDEMIENGDFAEIMADALTGVVADEYDPEKSGGYLALDYVLHDGKLYACTAYTSGSWDSTKWRECTVGDELNNLMTRVYGLNAGQVSYDETATYNSGTVGKAIGDFQTEINNLNTAITSEQNIRGRNTVKNYLPILTLADLKSINLGSWVDNVLTHQAVTYTVNTDEYGFVNEIIANGTASDGRSVFYFIRNTYNNDKLFLDKNVDYTILSSYEGVPNQKFFEYVDKIDGTSTYHRITGTKNLDFNISDTKQFLSLYFIVENEQTVSNVSLKPMIVIKGDEETVYESYAKTNRELTADVSDLNSAITSLQNTDTAIENGLAIISNGNVHYAIESGKYVYIKNHSTLAEGFYKANVTIPTNNPITATDVTPAPNLNGALNDLQNVSSSGYCKMPDGTAIAWGNVGGITFSSESIKEGTVTLPFAFISGNVFATPYNTSNVNFMLWIGASLQDSTTLAWTLATLNSSAISVTNRGFAWLVVGRWK